MEGEREFNLLHRDRAGRLLHAAVVKLSTPSWGTSGVLSLPEGLDIRDGDSITMTPKPVRGAETEQEPLFEEVD